MRRLVLVVAVLAVAILPATGWASPSLLGPTGLLLIPTADSLGLSQWNVGASWLSSGAEEAMALYGDVGLGIKGLEVGATWLNVEDADGELLLNAKFHLPQPVPVKLSVAAGVIDLTDARDATPYVVLSHMIGGGLILQNGFCTAPQVHVGLGGGRLDGLFGGVSAQVGDRVNVMAEYDGSEINLGARLPVAANVELTGAALDGLSDFGVGVSLSSPW